MAVLLYVIVYLFQSLMFISEAHQTVQYVDFPKGAVVVSVTRRCPFTKQRCFGGGTLPMHLLRLCAYRSMRSSILYFTFMGIALVYLDLNRFRHSPRCFVWKVKWRLRRALHVLQSYST